MKFAELPVTQFERVPLAEICPRCGNRMTETRMEHVIVRQCIAGHYSAKEITGESRLAWATARNSLR